jgi:cell division protease FtsH
MATDMARRMVTEWGMSDKLGMIHYGANQEEVFLGHSVTQSKNISEGTATTIDTEIKKLVHQGYDRAKHVLTTHLDELHKVAQALLEYEMLSGDEIKAILRGEKIVRKDDDDEGAVAATPTSSVPRGGNLDPTVQGA